MHQSTDIAGYVDEAAAELTGLAAGTPVVCGGGDGICAAVGTGCIKEGIAHSCMGTSSWISITSRKPIFDKEKKTFTWAHIIPGYVLPTGTMQSGGGSYAWFTRELSGYEEKCAREQNISMYDILEEELSRTAVGSNGLMFLPYLLGERSPRWNPDAKAGFIGLKMEHERKDMLRAVQEGVAMNLSMVLDTFREYGEKISEMVVIGGGAKSATWRRILADVYDVEIQKPNYMDEATSMGAAITAGVGVGVFQDFDVIDRFLKIEERIKPVEAHHGAYMELRTLFNKAYEALVPLFADLSKYKADI
ncbi:MAG: FGGY-family carbohydrate kinase [Lachnospiraceae bacterium]|nr:FGGY-family carbohydrate kinase [Lachnospiraceae bacterium]